MKIETLVERDRARLVLSGRFDYGTYKVFHDAYVPMFSSNAVDTIEVDMQRVDYLDSAALGMLLMLKEQAGVARKTVSLTNCNELVARTLRIAKFDTLFPIG